MNTNAKLLTGLLLASVTITGVTLAGTSTGTSLSFSGQMMNQEKKQEFEAIKTILDKKKSGTQLTSQEQTTLDAFESNHQSKGKKGHGRGGFGGREGWENGMMGGFGMKEQMELTSEEKTKLESMTEEQKKTFFETKRAENELKMEARETVIDKLLAGESLTDADKVIVEEIKTQRAEQKERKAQMKEIRTIMEKKRNGETLTDAEQAKLDQFHNQKDENKD